MTKTNSLLIVEDEVAIRSGLVDVFVYHGYQVDFAEDGALGLQKALTGKYDLIILDVMLPSMNGFEICQRIRQQDKAQPIIMLTAKSTDEDIIHGLSLGADDYVAKPFSVAQLVLRVQAVLRRSNKLRNSIHQIILSEHCTIDTQNLCLIGKDGETPFTKREIEVIEYLQQHRDRPVSREELLTEVWGYRADMEIETRTVDIHIAKIRRKIEPDPKVPVYLLTIRGAGYRLHSLAE